MSCSFRQVLPPRTPPKYRAATAPPTPSSSDISYNGGSGSGKGKGGFVVPDPDAVRTPINGNRRSITASRRDESPAPGPHVNEDVPMLRKDSPDFEFVEPGSPAFDEVAWKELKSKAKTREDVKPTIELEAEDEDEVNTTAIPAPMDQDPDSLNAAAEQDSDTPADQQIDIEPPAQRGPTASIGPEAAGRGLKRLWSETSTIDAMAAGRPKKMVRGGGGARSLPGTPGKKSKMAGGGDVFSGAANNPVNESNFCIAVATFQAVHSRYVEAYGTEAIAKLAKQKKLSPEDLLDFCDNALDAIVAGQTPPALPKGKEDVAQRDCGGVRLTGLLLSDF